MKKVMNFLGKDILLYDFPRRLFQTSYCLSKKSCPFFMHEHTMKTGHTVYKQGDTNCLLTLNMKENVTKTLINVTVTLQNDTFFLVREDQDESIDYNNRTTFEIKLFSIFFLIIIYVLQSISDFYGKEIIQ